MRRSTDARRWLLAAALGVVACLLALPADAGPQKAQPSRPALEAPKPPEVAPGGWGPWRGRCRVSVISNPESARLQRRRPVFAGSELLSLRFEVAVRPWQAPLDWLVLKVFTPDGHLYQTFEVPVAEEGSSEAERVVEGYPFPLKVAQARAVEVEDERGGAPLALQVVDSPPLPVAGTYITTHSLYGRWRVEAWTGAPRPCKARFRIKP